MDDISQLLEYAIIQGISIVNAVASLKVGICYNLYGVESVKTNATESGKIKCDTMRAQRAFYAWPLAVLAVVCYAPQVNLPRPLWYAYL